MKAATGAVLAIALLAIGTARAAAPDCARPADAMTKLVCGDPALTAAAAALSAAEDRATTALSPQGREGFAQGSSAWSSYTATLCAVDKASSPKRRIEAVQCLKSEFAGRQEIVDHATISAEGLVIRRINRFAIKPSNDVLHFTTLRIAYPSIDNAHDDSDAHWNELMARKARQLEKDGFKGIAKATAAHTDVSIDYDIADVSPDVISTVFAQRVVVHGEGHTVIDYFAINWLRREGRVLGAGDLFNAAGGWQDALTRLSRDAIKEQGRRDQLEYDQPSDAKLRAMVTRIDRWTLEPDGLAIQFVAYEIGPFAYGAPKITVPWTALKPYLAPAAPRPAG